MTALNSHAQTTRANAHAPGEVADFLQLVEQGSNPVTPAATKGVFFVKSGGVYYKNSAGTVTGPFTDTGGASFATPSVALGSSAAAGAAGTVIRSDATIAAFDATNPTTQAFSDSPAVGSAAFAARRDHKHGMPASPGGGSITSATAALAADVAISSVNTFFDGPSISLGAGTWLVVGQVTVKTIQNGGEAITAKLWDGTTVTSSVMREENVANYHNVLAMSGIVVLGSTATMKISVATAASTGTIRAAAPNNGAGNNASRISAIQIA